MYITVAANKEFLHKFCDGAESIDCHIDLDIDIWKIVTSVEKDTGLWELRTGQPNKIRNHNRTQRFFRDENGKLCFKEVGE